MNINRDIHSLTDFKQHTPDFVEQLKQTGEPLILTINGKAELVVQDAASYQKLLDLAEEARDTRRHQARPGRCESRPDPAPLRRLRRHPP